MLLKLMTYYLYMTKKSILLSEKKKKVNIKRKIKEKTKN